MQSSLKEFMNNCLKELSVTYKQNDVNMEAILSFVEDALKHIINEDEEEHETNQQYVGMQELFHGHA
jgi:hypothetical protein